MFQLLDLTPEDALVAGGCWVNHEDSDLLHVTNDTISTLKRL